MYHNIFYNIPFEKKQDCAIYIYIYIYKIGVIVIIDFKRFGSSIEDDDMQIETPAPTSHKVFWIMFEVGFSLALFIEHP